MRTYGSFLTAAATYNHLKVVEVLLEKEERVPFLNQALKAAAQKGHALIVKAILAKPTTLLHEKAFATAASYGRPEVLKLLFEHGIPQEQRDDALYQATDNEHEETVQLLLEHGADPNAEGPT
jgi:ankyrin repeat protein